MAHSDKYQDVIIKPGMSEAIDARLLPLGTPRLLQNVRTRTAARFEKRPGSLAMVTTGLPTVGNAAFVGEWNGLAVCGIESSQMLSTRTNLDLFAHNGVDSARWSWMGRYGACVPERQTTIAGRGSSAQYLEEGAVAIDGLLYVVYNDTVQSAINVLEMTPEGTVLRATSVSSEDSPRLVWTGVALQLITNAAGTVKVRALNLSTFIFATATDLATAAVGSTTAIDAAPLVGTNDWLLCYARTSTKLLCLRMTGHTVTNSADVTTTNEPSLYSIAGKTGENIFVVYNDGGTAQATIFTTALASPNEITIHVESATEAYTGQFVIVRTYIGEHHVLLGGYDTSASTPSSLVTPFTYSCRVNSLGTYTFNPVKVWHFQPIAKPIALGDSATERAQVYCWCGNGHASANWDTAFQARHVLLVFEVDFAWLTGLSYEHQHFAPSSGWTSSGSIADLEDGRFAAILPWKDPGKFAGFDLAVFSLSLPETSVAQAHRFTDTAGGALLISGGCLSDVTEAQQRGTTYFLQENGFAHAPLVRVEALAGGSMTTGQLYTYVACYRRIDNQGRVQHSAASAPVSITPSGGNLSVTVYVTTLGVSNRRTMTGETVVAEIYRSWLGGPYYYVGASTTVFASGESLSYADTVTDASIIDDDGTLDVEGAQPDAPSGARLLRIWGPRLAVVGWNEREVQLSKYYRSDTGYEFVDDDAFRVRSPLPIVAIGCLDGVGVIFTERRILICTGEGPDDRGMGFFDEPRELPAVVGADSPHVVEVAEGLIFKGGGTFWLLPRGFGPPQAIGDAVQVTLASYPYLRSAFRCSNADDDCTHFVLASSDLPAATTVVLVYDNRMGSWSRDDIAGEVGAAGSVDDNFTWLLPTWDAAADIPAREFSTAAFQDYTAAGASAFIERRIEFGDWRPAGIIGQARLGRIGILGEYGGTVTPPTLEAVITVDGSAEAARSYAMSGTAGSVAYREIVPTKQAGTAFQLSIYDAYNAGYVQTHAINALGIEIDTEPGLRRPGDGERS
jgi:hypothetical protein